MFRKLLLIAVLMTVISWPSMVLAHPGHGEHEVGEGFLHAFSATDVALAVGVIVAAIVGVTYASMRRRQNIQLLEHALRTPLASTATSSKN